MLSQPTTYQAISYYPYYAAPTNEGPPACNCPDCLARSSYVHTPYGHNAAVQPIVMQQYAWQQNSINQPHPGAAGKERSPSISTSDGSGTRNPQMTVTLDMLRSASGTMLDISRTPNGSSFLQAGLKSGPEAHSMIYSELCKHFDELLMDVNGCYVVRALLETLTHASFVEVVSAFAADEQLLVTLCTSSLHSRRMVQFMLEHLKPSEVSCFAKVMMKRCRDIAKTQQGCISIQRTLDRCDDVHRKELFAVIAIHCVEFAMDPFANYVIQYMLETGKMSVEIYYAFAGHFIPLCCNKFSSNVIEKCLYHWSPELQHAVLNEIFSAPDNDVLGLLQDSFGNYIVQSSIALASFKDLWEISSRLAPLLPMVPYGQKVESKILRRLRGKTIPRDPVAPVGC